jgi:hypothetical protein
VIALQERSVSAEKENQVSDERKDVNPESVNITVTTAADNRGENEEELLETSLSSLGLSFFSKNELQSLLKPKLTSSTNTNIHTINSVTKKSTGEKRSANLKIREYPSAVRSAFASMFSSPLFSSLLEFHPVAPAKDYNAVDALLRELMSERIRLELLLQAPTSSLASSELKPNQVCSFLRLPFPFF